MGVSAGMTRILTPEARMTGGARDALLHLAAARFADGAGDAHVYLVAAVLVGGAGGVAIASHLHVRWLDRRGWPAVAVHALVFAVLAVAGVAVIGWHTLNRGGWAGAAAGAAAGGPAGIAVSHLDLWLTRWMTRRGAGTGRAGATRDAAARGRAPLTAPRPATTSRVRATPVARDLAGSVSYGRSPATWTPTARDTAVPTALSWLLTAAVAEECVFRGVLTTAAAGVAWLPGRAACLAAAMAVFCLSHLYFGWPQVAAKAPLSLLATVLVLVTGCVAGAVVMHVVVNARVWRSARPAPAPRPAVPRTGLGGPAAPARRRPPAATAPRATVAGEGP